MAFVPSSWIRGAGLVGTAMLVAAASCAPPYEVKRARENTEEGAAGSGGEGGEGGTSGAGGAGGTQPDASSGGRGGAGGSPRDAAPDVGADRPADLATDMNNTPPDGPIDLGPGEPIGPGKTVLLVMGFVPPAMVRPGDLKLKARLEMRGFTVKIGDDDGMTTQSMGTQLVIITDTAGSQVAMKYTALNLPVICQEPTLFDDMRMTATAGAMNGTTTLEITQAGMGHPLAGGQMASITIAGNNLAASYGNPAMTATRIAAMPGQAATQSAIFGYESGTMMSGLAAPAKRVGLFITDEMANGMNETGWKLFDAAVDWALR